MEQNSQKRTLTTYKKVDEFYFDPTEPLGRGAFATVFKAYSEKDDALEVAAKMIPAQKLLESQDQYNMLMREIDVLRQIKGDHIVSLIDAKRTSNNLYIFTDFCNGGDLEKKIKSKTEFTETQCLSILKQIAHAFITLGNLEVYNTDNHRVVFMHRDIKPANILFHNDKVKVGDFGFAKIVDEVEADVKKRHTLLGTPLYMAPQILHNEPYSIKCDVWSTGVVFYEILFGKLPWRANSIEELYRNIKTKALQYPKDVDKDTKDLVAKMLQLKEEDRFSWEEVYNHPALEKIKCD